MNVWVLRKKDSWSYYNSHISADLWPLLWPIHISMTKHRLDARLRISTDAVRHPSPVSLIVLTTYSSFHFFACAFSTYKQQHGRTETSCRCLWTVWANSDMITYTCCFKAHMLVYTGTPSQTDGQPRIQTLFSSHTFLNTHGDLLKQIHSDTVFPALSLSFSLHSINRSEVNWSS